MGKDTRELRDKAQKAVDKGKWSKALEAYLELEKVDTNDGQWSRRAADCHRRLDQQSDAIVALMRGVEKYTRAGFMVKAVALCKMILSMDPEHTASQQALAEFSEQSGLSYGRRLATQPASPPPAPEPPPPEPPPAPPERVRTIPPGASLEDVSLNKVVPGSVEIQRVAELDSGIFEIPIDDFEVEFPADPEAEASHATEAATEVFPRTPLFSDLGPAQLAELVQKVDLVELAAGEVLFEQGESADALYVISEGAVAVISEGPPRVQLTRLGEGEFFGEIGLMTSAPRRATVEATEPTELIKINLDTIGDLIESEFSVLQVLLRFLRDRLIDNLVKTSPLFEPFGGAERAGLAARFRFLEIERGSNVVVQDSRAEGLYVLLSGKAEVVRVVAGQQRRLASLEPGDLFGEMSLLANEPAVATVRTTAKCFALQLPSATFREVIMTHPQVLMFIGDLADQRRRENAAIIDGSADYAEGHLELV